MIKLTIAVCSCRPMSLHFVGALQGLINYIHGKGINGTKVEHYLHIQAGVSLLSEGRQQVLNAAIERGHTHILFLDDDMTFPVDLCDKLFSRKKQAIGVNYCRKNPAYLSYTAVGLDGNLLQSKGETSCVEVIQLGLGVFLLELKALEGIDAPHFQVLWNERAQAYNGEDNFFCMKLVDNGVSLWCDQELSHRIGHMGDFDFCYEAYS